MNHPLPLQIQDIAVLYKVKFRYAESTFFELSFDRIYEDLQFVWPDIAGLAFDRF